MNITEFVNFCETLNKGTFTQISVITSPKMRKTNNPYYGRVKKLSTYVGEFFDYQKKMTKEIFFLNFFYIFLIFLVS